MHARRQRVGILLAFVLASLAVARAAPADPPLLVRGPYLQRGSPTRMVVRWRTDVPAETVLRYGPSSSVLPYTLDASPGGPTTEHEVEVTGLVSNSRTYYAVMWGGTTLAGGADHYFITSPPTGNRSFTRVWVVGDSGHNNVISRATRDAYLDLAGNQKAGAFLMLGDNAYVSGTDLEYTLYLFGLFPSILRNTVLWPSPGNHDFVSSDSATESGPYFDAFTLPRQGEAGGVPSQTEAYYSFDYANIHFVSLDSQDSDRSVGGTLYNWLDADLTASTQDWTIAYWHHPPYSKGTHDSDSEGWMVTMRQNIVPLLEQHGVDLVLAGHSHAYERSMLIDGHYGYSSSFDPVLHVIDGGDGNPSGDGAYAKPTLGAAPHEGTVYVVMGCSNRAQVGGTLDHPVMIRNVALMEGSLVLDVTGGRLDARFLSREGNVLDRFEITKGGAPAVPSLSGWAVALLGGALLAAGLHTLRIGPRRQKT